MTETGSSLERVLEGLSDAQKADLQRVAADLGIEPTDALWSVLAALEYYKGLYEQVPGTINRTVEGLLEKVKETTARELESSRAKVEESLVAAVSGAAQNIVGAISRRRLIQWAAGGFAAALTLCAVVFYSGFAVGNSAGYAHGRSDTLDLNAAASWAATPVGMEAFRLYQAGDLPHLSNCDLPGWMVKNGVCFPQASRGRVYGWNVNK